MPFLGILLNLNTLNALNLMKRFSLTVVCLIIQLYILAQQNIVETITADTIPKADTSALEDLRDNTIDNTPLITLDDNDLNDASA